MSISIEGLEEILKRFDDMASTPKVEAAVGKACALVERSAKEKAPKGTGELKRSITSRVESKGKDVKGIVFTPLFYAPYVEYGTGLFAEENGRKDVPWSYEDEKGEWHTTSGMKPQPYLRPALDENREKIIRLIKESLTND